MSARRSVLARTAAPFAVFAAVVLAWQVAALTAAPRWLPDLRLIGQGMADQISSGDLGTAGASTLRTFFIGLALTVVLGGLVAAVLASSDLLDEALSPLLNSLMAVPTVALIPVFVFIWGYSPATMVAAVFSFSFLPVTLQWATALREVPQNLLEMSSSFAAARPAQIRTVDLPSVAHLLIAGLRIGVVQGIKGVITAEVITGAVGLGRLLTLESAGFNMPGTWAVILIIVSGSLVSYVVLMRLETRSSRWADTS